MATTTDISNSLVGNSFYHRANASSDRTGAVSARAVSLMFDWMMYYVETNVTDSSGATKYKKLKAEATFQSQVLEKARELVGGQRSDFMNMVVVADYFRSSSQQQSPQQDSIAVDTSSISIKDPIVQLILQHTQFSTTQLAQAYVLAQSQASRAAVEVVRAYNLRKESVFHQRSREQSNQQLRKASMTNGQQNLCQVVDGRKMVKKSRSEQDDSPPSNQSALSPGYTGESGRCAMFRDPFSGELVYMGGGGSARGRSIPTTAELPYEDPDQAWKQVFTGTRQHMATVGETPHADVMGQSFRKHLSQTSRKPVTTVPFRF